MEWDLGVLMFSVWQLAAWNGIWVFLVFSVWRFCVEGNGIWGFLVFSVWRFCALICPVYAFLYLGLRANTERFWTIFPVHLSMRSPSEKTVLH